MIHPNPDLDSHEAILIQIWMLVTTCPDPDWDQFQIGMTIPIQQNPDWDRLQIGM